MTLFDLSGKVAVITGSSKGIGKAIALRMAEQGAKVVVSSRKRDACEAVAAEIAAAGGEAMVQPCHIGRKEELQALVDATLARWGRIDTLVCNAAINPFYGPSLEVSDEVYDRIMNYNVRSTFWLSNMVLPQMAQLGGGAIVIVSSLGGFQGNDKIGIYAVSKAAEMQLARNLAVEWGDRNVRVNCIAPGLIATDFARELWETPERRALAEANAPLKRIGKPDEIAGAAVFLASAAGEFMTGQTMIIDGGRAICGRVAT